MVIWGLEVFVAVVMLVSVLRIDLGDVDSSDCDGGMGVDGTEVLEVIVVGCDVGRELVDSDSDVSEALE